MATLLLMHPFNENTVMLVYATQKRHMNACEGVHTGELFIPLTLK